MKSLPLLVGAGVLVVQSLFGASTGHWPQWRGPLGTGEAPGAQPPQT